MRHEWIIEVLTDLSSYAQKNGLPELACKAEEAMTVARAEIAAAEAESAAQADVPRSPTLHSN